MAGAYNETSSKEMTSSARKLDRALAVRDGRRWLCSASVSSQNRWDCEQSVLVKPCDYPLLATAIVEIRAWDTLLSGPSGGDGLLCLPGELTKEVTGGMNDPEPEH
ncbi:uncharacterized protein LOC119386087 [Rhipicephalus sanguineus]|uniref:uncharacterized protein LOC119386087 n=1 Tax=Rhipicephalus sanguineus TaxID=34632 RepID=UPI0018945F31|nr:uncharacterized protein LOC119386087 [Rhipicephalus sanguineus]